MYNKIRRFYSNTFSSFFFFFFCYTGDDLEELSLPKLTNDKDSSSLSLSLSPLSYSSLLTPFLFPPPPSSLLSLFKNHKSNLLTRGRSFICDTPTRVKKHWKKYIKNLVKNLFLKLKIAFLNNFFSFLSFFPWILSLNSILFFFINYKKFNKNDFSFLH